MDKDTNIFSLDWSSAACRGGFSLTDLLAYNSAVNNVRVVSEYLTNFTVKLVKECDVKVNEILVIGHSLGAHVAGFAGKGVQQVLKQKYKQIIGLDPAAPEFKSKNCADRICKSDAESVQIFHTSYFAGMQDAIGDSDFYFNGGSMQPGCILLSCSHSRAVIYLTMTISHSPCFVGTPWKINSDSIINLEDCTSNVCTYPGLDTVGKNSDGIYYVINIQ